MVLLTLEQVNGEVICYTKHSYGSIHVLTMHVALVILERGGSDEQKQNIQIEIEWNREMMIS